MKTREVLDYFGTPTKVARAIGIAPPAIHAWGEYPPPLRQLQLQVLTNGTLKAEPSILSFPQSEEQKTA